MSNQSGPLVGHMNDTKWRELRDAMYALGDLHPRWRTLDVENGYLSDWDGDWYYHFELDGLATIEYVEIEVVSQQMRDAVRRELAQIHVPGRETELGFVVVGYTRGGESVNYIQDL